MEAKPLNTEELYFSVFLIFDTGFIFDFDHIDDEVKYSKELVETLNTTSKDFDWALNQNAPGEMHDFDRYAPPTIRYLIKTKLDNALNQKVLKIPVGRETVDCELYHASAYLFLFNTGVIECKVSIPKSYWEDKPSLRTMLHYMNVFGDDVEWSAQNLQGVFGEVLKKLKAQFFSALDHVDAPRLEVPYLKFQRLVGDFERIRWGHVVLNAIMPEGFDPTSLHYQDVVESHTARGVCNFSTNKEHFAFSEIGNTLLCVPNVSRRGLTPAQLIHEDWLRWLRLHQTTWKMVWELDSAMSAVINTTTNNLKYIRKTVSSIDLRNLNAFNNYIWLKLDSHKPRNITTSTRIHHYYRCIDESWHTQLIKEDVIVKMQALSQVVHQMDDLGDASRSRNMSRFLAMVGVFGLGTFLMQYHANMQFTKYLGDVSTSVIVFGILSVFSFMAYNIMK